MRKQQGDYDTKRGEEERGLLGYFTLLLPFGSSTLSCPCFLTSCPINLGLMCVYQVQVSYPWEESRSHARKGLPLSFPLSLFTHSWAGGRDKLPCYGNVIPVCYGCVYLKWQEFPMCLWLVRAHRSWGSLLLKR